MAASVDKFQIAELLRETSTLLTARGENTFKARAYATAARSMEAAEDFERLFEENNLTDLPGIGDSLASYIKELASGKPPKMLADLRAELPPGLHELSALPGLTLKRVQKLNQLGIDSIADLERACRSGKLKEVKGLGGSLEKELLKAIEKRKTSGSEILLVDLFEISDRLIEYLKEKLDTDAIALAGEARRWHESADKIAVVLQLDDFENEKARNKARTAMKKFALVTSVHSERPDYVLASLAGGISVELFLTDSLAWTLFVQTGSSEHLYKMQKRAERKKYTFSPEGLKLKNKLIQVHSEKEIYAKVGLSFIPPELREGLDEVSLAETDDFEDLIDTTDIKGMTHCHSVFSDGRHTIEQMARAVKSMGMSYMTMTDHSPTAHYAGGLDIDRLKEQWEEIDRVQELVGLRIFKGTECDIIQDGRLDYPDHILDKFDVIIASIHSRYRQNEKEMTKRLLRGLRNPHFKIWGHPLGRLVLRRDPIPCDVPAVLEAIAEARVAIEINGDPHRLDLEPRYARIARELGLKFVISTDAHATAELQNLRYGVHQARRAGLRRDDVLNTLTAAKFFKIVKAK